MSGVLGDKGPLADVGTAGGVGALVEASVLGAVEAMDPAELRHVEELGVVGSMAPGDVEELGVVATMDPADVEELSVVGSMDPADVEELSVVGSMDPADVEELSVVGSMAPAQLLGDAAELCVIFSKPNAVREIRKRQDKLNSTLIILFGKNKKMELNLNII